MPELNFTKDVPTKKEVETYLNEAQLFPMSNQALGFELLKLIRRVNKLELWQDQ